MTSSEIIKDMKSKFPMEEVDSSFKLDHHFDGPVYRITNGDKVLYLQFCESVGNVLVYDSEHRDYGTITYSSFGS